MVWSQEGTGRDVFGRRFDANGVAMGPAFPVHQDRQFDQDEPDVDCNPSGECVVVWAGDNREGPAFGDVRVFARRFDVHGIALGSEFLAGFEIFILPYPRVAVADDGSFVVGASGTLVSVWFRRFGANGVPLTPRVSPSERYTLVGFGPSLASRPDGAFAIAWQGRKRNIGEIPTAKAVFALFSGTAAAETDVVEAGSIDSSSVRAVEAAFVPDGALLLVWERWDNLASEEIIGRFFDESGDPGSEELILSGDAPRRRNKPRVATDGNGNSYVVWNSEGVYFRRFDRTGSPLAIIY